MSRMAEPTIGAEGFRAVRASSAPLERSGTVALAVAIGFWAITLATILRHRIFITHDSMISYAHVWFVSDRMWHHHDLPLHMASLGDGHGFTFPYGFVPWVTAALFRPLFGDWIVTLWLVLGGVGTAVATFWTFPELRRGWWAAAVLVNPALVAGVLIGELPFMWASTMFLLAIGCWRRARYVPAIVLAALAQITHPAVLLPIVAGTVLLRLRWEPDRRALLRAYAISVVPALPAAWIVLRSPVYIESSRATKIGQFIGTVGPRALVIAIPVVLVVARKWGSEYVAPALAALCIAGNIAMGLPFGITYAQNGLARSSTPELGEFVASRAFVPGATYRMLRTNDGRIGLYEIVQHDGRLDSEFFPESMRLNSLPGVRVYSELLASKHVDYVIAFRSYDEEWHTNEHQLLEQLTQDTARHCTEALVSTRVVFREPDYDVYAVDRSCASRGRRA